MSFMHGLTWLPYSLRCQYRKKSLLLWFNKAHFEDGPSTDYGHLRDLSIKSLLVLRCKVIFFFYANTKGIISRNVLKYI